MTAVRKMRTQTANTRGLRRHRQRPRLHRHRGISSRPGGPAGLIVFQKEAAEVRRGQLFTIRPDGTGLRQITHGPTSWVNADWSPDGKTLAFSHYLPDSALVSLMNADGSNVRAVTPEGFQDAPSFTPDGKALVYTRDPSPSEDGLWTVATRRNWPATLDSQSVHSRRRVWLRRRGQSVARRQDGRVRPHQARQRDARAASRSGIDGTGRKPLLPYTPAGREPSRLVAGRKANRGDHRREPRPGQVGERRHRRTERQGAALGDSIQGRSEERLRRRVLARRQVARHPYRSGAMHGMYLVHPNGGALHRVYVSPDIERGIGWGKGTS